MFNIDRDLAVRLGPFQKSVDIIILEKVEELLNYQIKLFYVDYKEIKSNKPGFRMFHISKAYNQRDK